MAALLSQNSSTWEEEIRRWLLRRETKQDKQVTLWSCKCHNNVSVSRLSPRLNGPAGRPGPPIAGLNCSPLRDRKCLQKAPVKLETSTHPIHIVPHNDLVNKFFKQKQSLGLGMPYCAPNVWVTKVGQTLAQSLAKGSLKVSCKLASGEDAQGTRADFGVDPKLQEGAELRSLTSRMRLSNIRKSRQSLSLSVALHNLWSRFLHAGDWLEMLTGKTSFIVSFNLQAIQAGVCGWNETKLFEDNE